MAQMLGSCQIQGLSNTGWEGELCRVADCAMGTESQWAAGLHLDDTLQAGSPTTFAGGTAALTPPKPPPKPARPPCAATGPPGTGHSQPIATIEGASGCAAPPASCWYQGE